MDLKAKRCKSSVCVPGVVCGSSRRVQGAAGGLILCVLQGTEVVTRGGDSCSWIPGFQSCLGVPGRFGAVGDEGRLSLKGDGEKCPGVIQEITPEVTESWNGLVGRDLKDSDCSGRDTFHSLGCSKPCPAWPGAPAGMGRDGVVSYVKLLVESALVDLS